jgi:hypothetical protein
MVFCLSASVGITYSSPSNNLEKLIESGYFESRDSQENNNPQTVLAQQHEKKEQIATEEKTITNSDTKSFSLKDILFYKFTDSYYKDFAISSAIGLIVFMPVIFYTQFKTH